MSLIPPVLDAAAAQRAVPAPVRSTLVARLRWLARAFVAVSVAAVSLLLLAWLTLYWGILPHIQQWRPQIEARASAVLGVPLRIGSIEMRSSGWVPALELRDVVLLDARQQPALRLPRIAAAISARSLLGLQFRFEQLFIDGAQLEARRDRQGRIFIAGLDLSGAGGSKDDTAALDWFFQQHEFVIRGGGVRWTDEMRQAPPLVLNEVEIVVRNRGLRHDVRLDATPPAGWGDRFTLRGRFSQPLLARSGQWERWSGEAYASLPRADVRQLRRHVDLPFELDEGDGALRGWFEVKDGQPRAATVDVALRAVTLRLSKDVEALAFERIEGRVVGQRDKDGLTLALQHFGFATGDAGQPAFTWPPGDMRLRLRQPEGQPVAGGEFSADRLDVGLLAETATRVPIGKAVRELLDQLAPQGIVSGLALQWDGPVDDPTRYRAEARLTGLSLASRASDERDGIGRPGLRNATVQLQATEAGGEATLRIDDGLIDLPGVFSEPVLPLQRLAADLQWRIEPVAGQAEPKLTVRMKNVALANADVEGTVVGAWHTGPGSGTARGGRFPGQLELDATIARATAARTARYLPLGLPQDTRDYLDAALTAGQISRGAIHIRGDLWDFPFYTPRGRQEGEFRFAAHVEDATLAYVPGRAARGAEPAQPPWPALTGLSADVSIERASLDIRNGRAQLAGAQWSQMRARIPDLAERPVLSLDATGRGPAADMLRFVAATPIAGWTGGALAKTVASGAAELQLGLTIPLTNVDASTVKGSLALAGNDVRMAPDTPLLAAARGRVDFTEKGLTVPAMAVRLYGGEVGFTGGSQPDGALRFTGQGTATAEALRRAAELGPVARLAQSMTGQAAYQASLGFVHGLPELSVTSNLVGIAADLPPPFNKAAGSALPLRYQTAFTPDAFAPGQVVRDTLRIEAGTLLQAQYLREWSGDAPVAVRRGGIGVMEPAPRPAAGVAAAINLAVLDTDAWQRVADRVFPPAPAPGGAGAASGGGGAPSVASTPPPNYAPELIGLRVQRLVAGGREVNALVAGVSSEGGLWRANVASDQLSGYVEYRPPSIGAARVYARLARLSLPKSDVDQVESLLDEQPASIPALDVVVDDLELRGKHLGRVEIEAVNQVSSANAAAGRREWYLSKFNLLTPEAQLTGTGYWLPTGPAAGRRSVMNFRLALADSGAYLGRLGSLGVVRGGKGQLAGEVSWLGSPLSLDYASLSGKVQVNIASGQFLKADAGAARLLGVLSLQSLPRRLALDFRDLFQEGFAFDSITGDLAIAQGVAQTQNLRMRGLQAIVAMEGSADLAAETQDLRVVVIPEINAGAASLAYAAINPAVGLGTFLAQLFLRKPLTEASTREFHITGPWTEPKMERVERRLFEPLPALGEPPAASSAASAPLAEAVPPSTVSTPASAGASSPPPQRTAP